MISLVDEVLLTIQNSPRCDNAEGNIGRFKSVSIFILLIVPRRYFCGGSFSLGV